MWKPCTFILSRKFSSRLCWFGGVSKQAVFGQLGALINQVEAFVKARILTPAEGEPLIDLANEASDATKDPAS